MNMWEAIVIIVAVTSLARVMRGHTRGQFGDRLGRHGRHGIVSFAADEPAIREAVTRETGALRRELTAVTERVKVLERIITDNRHADSVAAEIEALRDR
jgi:hypothetical protein